MSAAELQALKTLNKNNDIEILPAGKGNSIVIINKEDCAKT